MTIWKYTLYTILVICLLLAIIAGLIFSINYKKNDDNIAKIEKLIENNNKLIQKSIELEREKIKKISTLRGNALTNYIRSLKK